MNCHNYRHPDRCVRTGEPCYVRRGYKSKCGLKHRKMGEKEIRFTWGKRGGEDERRD